MTMPEIADDRVLAELLVRQKPFWEAGKGYGYHAFVIGALTGEVVRRAAGASIQALYEERIRAPYGLDLYLGLPGELEPRYEPVRAMNPTPAQARFIAAEPEDPASLLAIAFNSGSENKDFTLDIPNTREVRAKGPASVGGVGNARGVAGMYAAALTGLGGEPLLRAETIAEFSTPHLSGQDLVTGAFDAFGLGFERPVTEFPALGPDAFGHCGVAGSARPRRPAQRPEPTATSVGASPSPAARHPRTAAHPGAGRRGCQGGLVGSSRGPLPGQRPSGHGDRSAAFAFEGVDVGAQGREVDVS